MYVAQPRCITPPSYHNSWHALISPKRGLVKDLSINIALANMTAPQLNYARLCHLRKITVPKQRPPLDVMLSRMAPSVQRTQPQDMIYIIPSLNSDSGTSIVPDCTKDVPEILADTTAAILVGTNDLDAVALASSPARPRDADSQRSNMGGECAIYRI
jgi:hypothetical protein